MLSPGRFVRRGSADRRYRARETRTRGRESRSMPQSGENPRVRTGPTGQQERIQWMYTLRDLEPRMTTIEGQQRTCAQSVEQDGHVSQDHTARLMAMDEDIRNYKNSLSKPFGMTLILFV